jgi:hypothetical protein
MKQLRVNTWFATFLMFVFALLQMPLWAQEGNTGTGNNNTNTTTSETTTSTTTTYWYTEPWVWVVGGAVLLLIIVALVRGSGSTDREVHRTTVIKDH